MTRSVRPPAWSPSPRSPSERTLVTGCRRLERGSGLLGEIRTVLWSSEDGSIKRIVPGSNCGKEDGLSCPTTVCSTTKTAERSLCSAAFHYPATTSSSAHRENARTEKTPSKWCTRECGPTSSVQTPRRICWAGSEHSANQPVWNQMVPSMGVARVIRTSHR